MIIITISQRKKKETKKRNEGDREDANRPHGHLIKQPPNVR